MDFVLNFIKFYLIFLGVRIFINSVFKIKIVKPRTTEAEIPSSNKFPDADIKEVAIDMVFDEICNTYVPKDKAYQVVEDNATHYFCSWECREEFIKTKP